MNGDKATAVTVMQAQ